MKVIEWQNNFRVSAEDLAASIGKVGAVAKQSGMSIHDLNAMTTTLVASMGIDGSEAATAIKSLISRVYRVGEEDDGGKAQELLKKYGIEVIDLQGKVKPLNEILGELSKQFANLSQKEKLQIEQTLGG